MLKREHKIFKLISRPDEEKGTKNIPFTLSALVPGQATFRKPDFPFAKLQQRASRKSFHQGPYLLNKWLERMKKNHLD